jgi:hypothetical protein
LRKIAAIATVISGDANEIAVASTIGSRASAEKLQKHAANADETASEMSERADRAHRRHQLVAPGIDQYHRQDGEGGAEEYGLPNRILLAEIAH